MRLLEDKLRNLHEDRLAREKCLNLSDVNKGPYDLLSIRSYGENEFVSNVFNTSIGKWIGLSKEAMEIDTNENYKWSDGEIFGYNTWAMNQTQIPVNFDIMLSILQIQKQYIPG